MRCVWCDSVLHEAPTGQWFISSASKHICYRCVLDLAKIVLRGLEIDVEEKYSKDRK